MGIFIHEGKILESDNCDEWGEQRAINEEEIRFRQKVNRAISQQRIKDIVRGVLIEEGLIEPPKVKHNPYDDEKWALLRMVAGGDDDEQS